MNKRLLAITGAFVPNNDTITLITYKHLRLLDYLIDVIALKGEEDPALKEILQKDPCFHKFHIEYITDYDKAIATLEKKNVLCGIFNTIKYIKAAKTRFYGNKYEVIYYSSIPAFTHLAAYLIKRKNKNVIWIASFSDPLVNSPYKKDKETINEYNLITKIGFYVYIFVYMNNLYEKLAMKYADKLIYISDEQRDFMIASNRQLDSSILQVKSQVIPLNYIKDWPIYQDMIDQQSKHVTNQPLIAAHFGRIYGLRKIDSFLEALQLLNAEIPELYEKIIFKQYGEIIPRYQAMIKSYHLEKLFIIEDKIPYNEALIKMKDCDILLLFDTLTKQDEPQPYLPSKILEYIILRKPILALCQKNSPANRLLTGLGYDCLANDAMEIHDFLITMLNDIPEFNYDISIFENSNMPRII